MKKIFLFFIAITIVFTACKPLEDQMGYEEEPYFFINGLSNSIVKLEGGKNNFYHFTRHQRDNDFVYEFIAELKNDSCESCDERFKLIIRSESPITDTNQFDIFKHIRNGSYDYEQSLSLNRHRTVEFIPALSAVPNAIYDWDFGDGHHSNSSIAKHTYKNDSNYIVKFKYTEGNCTKEVHKSIEITTDSLPMFCNVDFDYQLISNTVIKFGGNDTVYGGVFAWDFGDGNTSNLPNPTHTYAVPGNYNVSLNLNRVVLGCNSMVMKTVQTNLGTITCDNNFSFHQASLSAEDSMQLSKVTVVYIDRDNVEYRTDITPQYNSTFVISDVQPYQNNERGDPVIIFNVDFSCRLFGTNFEEIDWRSFRGRLGVSYPK